MYIKQQGKYIEVYENGRRLTKDEAIRLIEETLPMADEQAVDILCDALILLENQRDRRS